MEKKRRNKNKKGKKYMTIQENKKIRKAEYDIRSAMKGTEK